MDPFDFIHDLKWEDIPVEVQQQAKRCLLDTIGVAAGGFQTETRPIVYNHAHRVFGGVDTPLWFDGRPVSAPGAVMAHGTMIDSLDMHDSCRPVKGHAGIAQVPAAFATLGMSNGPVSGKEFLTTLAMAYDIAIRAGTAQHATVCDYHSSGSWNAVGTAAIVARRLGLDRERTRHALGAAEYHGPRAQMMRLIDYPNMLKDSSGWGGMAGVSAGLLAADGMTGAPAITVEAADAAEYWADLGERYSLMIQYFKPYAVCYWAQAAIAGALQIQRDIDIDPDQITRIEVYTFHEASRLAMREPTNSDEAQYSLPFPVGAALVHGKIGLEQLRGDALENREVLRLSRLVDLIDDDSFNARFPAERLSRVVIETSEGGRFDSGEVRPLWDLSAPPSDDELLDKFREITYEYLPSERAKRLEELIWGIEDLVDVGVLVEALAEPAS